MTNETAKARKDRKRAEAKQRQAAYDALSHKDKDKLSRALKRGGKESREYKRLAAR